MAKYNPMNEYVTVCLPRASGSEENFVYAGLNGRGYKILRGAQVRLPKPVAELLWESERLQNARDAYSDAQQNR